MKYSLIGLGASTLMVVALTACGGGTAAAPASAPASETATATPTPAKQYTDEELVALVKQIKASDGSSPAVLSGEELLDQFDPITDTFGKVAVEPAGCKDLAMLGVPQPVAGSSTAGTARTKTNDFFSNVSLTSGVDIALLQENVDTRKSQAEACEKVTFSAEGQSVTTSTEKVDGVGSMPGTAAFKTLMVTPDGKTGAIYTAHVIKDGVLISATASGTEGAAGGPEAAGALLDQAAALIK